MFSKTFSVSAENFTMKANVAIIGKDVLIALTGGDTPHIGTVTTVEKNSSSETLRFSSHHGRFHKDEVLSEEILKKIKPLLPGNCVMTAGVHVNGITKAQIKASFSMAEKLGEEIFSWLENYDFSTVNEAVYENYQQTFDE